MMQLLAIMNSLPKIGIIDLIDIIVVGLLLFFVLKLVRGTNALNIFVGFFILYLLNKIVNLLGMKIMSDILGGFISLGIMALIVIFQPEIRQFLTAIGSRGINRKGKKILLWRTSTDTEHFNSNAIVQACGHMSASYTGALIILCQENKLEDIIASGEVFKSELSSQLLETIFFKNTPLHDGALIIDNGKIQAARCILPVSHSNKIPLSMGLRHRSALGVTEVTDAIAIVVSEQTGKISIAEGGEIQQGISLTQLQGFLDRRFNNIDNEETEE